MLKTVMLIDDTIGTVTTDAQVGDMVRVKLQDENGNTIEAAGLLAEIIDVCDEEGAW